MGNEEMKKIVTARNFDLSDRMKSRAEADMNRLQKFFGNIVSGELILSEERHLKRAELIVKVYNNTIAAKADSEQMYTAIGLAFDKVTTQLKKYKGKLKEKKPAKIESKVRKSTRPSTNVEELDI